MKLQKVTAIIRHEMLETLKKQISFSCTLTTN